jgi:hypothetical protein
VSTPTDPNLPSVSPDDDLDTTVGCWDPYVASLMLRERPGQPGAGDDDDGAPVMSFARLQGKRGR